MQGFKSFAKKTEIVFGDDFNCILGPNGSGKSNVLDALCFVLGKKSAKSLRAEKSANLIYNGGKTKQAAKQAEVSIYFENHDEEFPVEEKEVKLTRIVKSTGVSTYKINNKTMNRIQVVELLSNARINPDGYNIVLQGDIVRIVEMSPLERRRIIEEIAGINIYEDKKQKALNELNKVEEKLKESDIILAERQAYLRELKKERNQAMKFKELDEKIKRNKATRLHVKINIKEKKKQGIDKDIKAKQESISKVDKEIKELKERIVIIKEDINKINKEIEEKGDKDQIRIQKIIEELRVNVGTNKSRINSIENELTRVAERKAQLQQSYDEINEKIKRLESERITYEKSINQKESQIKQLESKISGFKSKHKLSDSDNIEKEIEDLDKRAEDKLKEIQDYRETQQNLLREKDKFEYQIDSADEKIAKVLSIKKEHQRELENLTKIRQQFKQATLELNTRLNADSEVTAQLSTARSRLLKIKEELAKNRAKQVGMKENSKDIAIQKILESKNRIKGIFGTVSSLGQVNSEYSQALEVAAGGRIKSIVVESDKVASECIKLLKQSRLGVASFLPLNKIRPAVPDPNVSKVLNYPGVQGRAVDLVKFNPKYKNVFSYVFGNTVVVENIGVARKIGVGTLRMVTLDGDLTELSGAMHGGYRKRTSSHGFQEKELVTKIEEYEAQEADLEGIVSDLETKKRDNEERITKLRHEKAELEADIIKIEKSLHLEDSDLDISKNMKKDLKEQIEKVSKELNELQLKISKSNSELAQIKMQKQQLRDKINALKNPRLIAELNTYEQKKTELREEIIRIKSDMKNIEAQIETIMKPEITNTKKILKQHEKEVDTFTEEIKQLKALIKVEEKDLKEKEGMQKEFYSKYKALFKKRDSINEDLNKTEQKQYKKDESRRNIELSLNKISLDNAKITAELEGLLEEFKEYENVPIFKDKDEEKIKREIWEFERMVNNMGAVNMRALEIYDAVEKEYTSVLDKKELLVKERHDVLLMMNEIETKKKDLFMNTFEGINDNFKKKFVTLSTKGEATLELEDPETVFEGGLNIKVRLTGKKFMDIRSLSGGEKTMTALAFLFAVQDHEPAPFYVLDEVDAALDKRNAETLASLIRQYIDKAQYIVISHNDGVISEADNLYGVSMNEHGMSKVVSLRV
ncbi:chromosome segregation protein SMC [archaeon]|nr:chromosome segregation protein SMC [archaeon]MBT4272144.1 chromosome segregation protein SMC [archaeon]MBT4460325.1 chromosome segregation protein SMC [archaeon]MBT4858949.1 chromosome segregation protein SMC [archaeon]MBT7440007.1 chromosome segregation protein SMC [archaeon]